MAKKLHSEERSEDRSDDGHELDEDVEARARRVFEGVAYRVAYYRSRVRRRAFAAEVAAFYVFLAVVPRASRVGHEYGHHDSGDYRSAEHSAEGRRSKYEADEYRRKDRHEARYYHFFERSSGGDVYAALVFRASRAFHYAGDFSELASDFFYHFFRRAAYSLYRQGAEEEGEESADEEAYHYVGVFEVYGAEVGGFGVGDEEG